MQILSTTHKYNNISASTSVYAAGQPVLLGLSVTSGNNEPTYVTLTNGSNTIEDLQPCRIDYGGADIDVIDIAPFVRQWFGNNESILTATSTAEFIAVNITIENAGETETPDTIKAYFVHSFVEYGSSPILAAAPINEQADGKQAGVYTADVALNDLSPLFLPNISISHFQRTLYATTADVLTSTSMITTIGTNTSIFNVTKSGTSSALTIGTRQIKRIAVCATSLIVRYLNNYDVFELFMFDEHNKKTYKTTQGDRTNCGMINNTTTTIGTVHDTTIEETITAAAVVSDADYLQKYVDFCRSRRVFVFVGELTTADFNDATKWIEANVSATANVQTNKPAQRVTAEFTIKNTAQW